MLALKQQNAVQAVQAAQGVQVQVPIPVAEQNPAQAVQAVQGVQVQVPIPVAEAVPVSEQPGVADATAKVVTIG